MKSKKIIDRYKSGIKKNRKQYYWLLEDFDRDENHNFRVEIKKLRAFIRLANISSQGYPNKLPKDVKKFYHHVGDIRNLQLHEQRVTALCTDLLTREPLLYLQYLQKEEKSKKKKAKQMAGKISFKDFKVRLTSNVPENISGENKNEFLKNSILRLTQLLALPFYYDETLHDIRKVIKDVMYNYDCLKAQISSAIPSPLNDLNFIESLTDALGNFHDLSLAVFFLSPPYLDQTSEEKERLILCELKSHFQLRKDHLKNELCGLLTPVKHKFNSGKS